MQRYVAAAGFSRLVDATTNTTQNNIRIVIFMRMKSRMMVHTYTVVYHTVPPDTSGRGCQAAGPSLL